MAGCKKKETEIYKLENYSISKDVDGILILNEIFIVIDPPSDKDKLLDILKEFSDSSLDFDLSKQNLLTRRQTFYKETDVLKKGYVEKDPNKSGYFEKVDLSGFYADILFESEWTISKRVTGYYTSYIDSKVGKTTQFVRDF